jgi:hypothetical protein
MMKSVIEFFGPVFRWLRRITHKFDNSPSGDSRPEVRRSLAEMKNLCDHVAKGRPTHLISSRAPPPTQTQRFFVSLRVSQAASATLFRLLKPVGTDSARPRNNAMA